MAAGGLAYEIALTRLLSALLVTSWVAPVLAVALLGVGLGSALAAAFPAVRTLAAARVSAATAAALAVVALPAWLWAVAGGRPLVGLALPLLAYVALGATTAAILSWSPPRAPWLLRADYAAAAVAAAGTPWLIGQAGLGAPGACAVAAALMALAAGVLGRPVAVIVPFLAVAAVMTGLLSVAPASHMGAKRIALDLRQGGVLAATRWDATARTDLVLMPNGARYLYMDGGAGSLVPTATAAEWAHDVGAFAFMLEPAGSAFLIGTGGGLDVAQARLHGVERVTAVEVNPASVALVKELGAIAASVYQEPTKVVIGDGRRTLAASDARYDVISLANVVTGAAELLGAALTENLVYTVEAFSEYLAHLTTDGRVALKLYDEATLTRALTTAVAALVESGHAADAAAAMNHLLAVLDVSAEATVPLLIVKRSPFTLEQAVAAARAAEQRGWALLLVPGLLAPPALEPLTEGTVGLEDVIEASSSIDLTPTRDAAPYFFSFEPGVPSRARIAGLLAAVVLAVLVIAAASVRPMGARAPREPVTGRLLAAVLLGCGVLLVELAALPVIQRSAGHPAWSLSLTLGAVLLGSAVGAQLAARSRALDPRSAAALAAVAVAAWVLAAPRLLGGLMVLPSAASGSLLAGSLLLVAIPMGAVFPRVLASLERPALVAAALSLSGVAAVVAGAGALWLSHSAGTLVVGLTAAGTYLLAALVVGARAR